VYSVVKDILHTSGKHLYKRGGYYHVALPSENERIAAKYRSKASRAMTKAKTLTSNTPTLVDEVKSNGSTLNFMMTHATHN
jgi:hypothetical protein